MCEQARTIRSKTGFKSRSINAEDARMPFGFKPKPRGLPAKIGLKIKTC